MELISRNHTRMMATGQALSPAWSYLEWKTLLIRTTVEPWQATIYVKTFEFHENTDPQHTMFLRNPTIVHTYVMGCMPTRCTSVQMTIDSTKYTRITSYYDLFQVTNLMHNSFIL